MNGFMVLCVSTSMPPRQFLSFALHPPRSPTNPQAGRQAGRQATTSTTVMRLIETVVAVWLIVLTTADVTFAGAGPMATSSTRTRTTTTTTTTTHPSGRRFSFHLPNFVFFQNHNHHHHQATSLLSLDKLFLELASTEPLQFHQQQLKRLQEDQRPFTASTSNVVLGLHSVVALPRGGAATEEDEEYDDDDDEEEDDEEERDEKEGVDWVALAKDVGEQVLDVTTTKVVPVVVAASQKAFQVARAFSISAYHALQRAYCAGIEGDGDEEEADEEDDDEEEEVTMLHLAAKYAKRSFKILKRMVVAALDFPDEDADVIVELDMEEDHDDKGAGDDEEEEEDVLVVETKLKAKTVKAKKTVDEKAADSSANAKDDDKATKEAGTKSASSTQADFGSYLAETYNVADVRGDGKKRFIILDGSFKDALQKAKDQARLLVVFIPATKAKSNGGFPFFGGGGGGGDNKIDGALLKKDQQAIESLFSKEVQKAAAKKPLKKGDKTLGSYAVWGAKAGSSEANQVFKRLKVTETSTKGEKRPILCVVYPSYGLCNGMPKIVPSLLAQHHGNPPPEPEDMAAWMHTLRKRHSKHYEKLQKDVADLLIYKEVTEGVKESIKSDQKREKEEAEAEAERKAKEEAEMARQAAVEERRKQLLEELPDDQKGSDVKKIALRFADGQKGERGFDPDQPVSALFNWVDAVFGMEREKVVLTTMNGKITFSWDENEMNDTSLKNTGLGKSTAFRVTEKVDDEEKTKLVL